MNFDSYRTGKYSSDATVNTCKNSNNCYSGRPDRCRI